MGYHGICKKINEYGKEDLPIANLVILWAYILLLFKWHHLP